MHSKKHSMIAFPRFKLPYSTNSSMRHSQCSALQSSRRLNSRTHSQWKVRTSHPFNTNWQTAVESKIYFFFLSLLLSRPCSFYFLSLPPYHPPSDPTQTTECQMDGESVLRTIDRWKAKPMSISQRHKSKMRYRHVSLP